MITKKAIEVAICSLRWRAAIEAVKSTANTKTRGQSTCSLPQGKVHGAGVFGGTDAGRELICNVSVSETLPLATNVGDPGLNVQVEPAGRFRHWKDTSPVIPFSELTVIAK